MTPLRKKIWLFLFSSLALFVLLILLLPLPKPLFALDYAKVLLDRDGALLDAHVADDQQWRFPMPDKLPAQLRTATLLAEDEYFNYHFGVNPISIGRAIRQNWKAGKIISGGSTITMQLIRLSQKNPPRTWSQKVYESLLSLKVELLYSKKEILQLYLGHAPYGGNLVGSSAAAWFYFGRALDRLSPSEYALLAVLPNHPGFLFPGKNEHLLKAKRDRLLTKWAEHEKWSNMDLQLYQDEPLPKGKQSIPHLAYHLTSQLKKPEFRVRSTLKKETQRTVVNIINEKISQLEQKQIFNGACLVVEVESGDVVAYVGNAHPLSSSHGRKVDIIKSARSPGSLLKPILYAQSIKMGQLLPQQFLPDYPLYINGFSPKNFNRKFQGVVPADRALASSLNVPFVHLLKKYGYQQFHQDLVDAEITLPEGADHYGMSIILGGIETNLWELVGVYRQMAYNQASIDQTPLDQPFTHFKEKIRIKNDSLNPAVFKGEGWYDPHSLPHMFRGMTLLRRPGEMEHWDRYQDAIRVAWKTGTSYGFRDAWALGISSEYVVGVWVGNADGQGRPDLIGSKIAGPVLFEILKKLKAQTLNIPNIGDQLNTCAVSGFKAGPLCPLSTINAHNKFHDGPLCPYHKLIWMDSNAEFRVHQNCVAETTSLDTVFTLPPQMAAYNRVLSEPLPPWHADCANINHQMTFIYPSTNTKISIGHDQANRRGSITLSASHSESDALVYWYVNGEYLGQTQSEHKMNIKPSLGIHQIRILDQEGTMVEQEFEVIK